MNSAVIKSQRNETAMRNTFVIFGGTGDLTNRKLLPAFFHLLEEEKLPQEMAIVIIGRRPYSQEQYLAQLETILSPKIIQNSIWKKLQSHLYYYQMNYENKEEYPSLEQFLSSVDEKHHTNHQRIYYLAVAPEYFAPIVDYLEENKLLHPVQGYPKVVIEKPFGKDLNSASYLNGKIVSRFKEENTYRIDHYLGKEMLQNIMVIRFANALFEPIWNKDFIEQIQISSLETIGIETRGDYYEKSGATRDMAQSHLLQLLSLVAMEKPASLSSDAIRDEKVKVLNRLKRYPEDEIHHHIVRAQYQSYRQEPKVYSESSTETYFALHATIDNPRWSGVPFFIRTGKKAAKKETEIIIQFKAIKNGLYPEVVNLPNFLVIKIQPSEGIFFQFNAKKPGTQSLIVPVQMDFCQNCQTGINSPEAYERLLFDVIRGDATLFARWDEVKSSWEFIDSIMTHWANHPETLSFYPDNTWGPIASDELMRQWGYQWINLGEKE